MTDVTLYDRDPNYIPRVAAVHDMCGYGKCSLTAAIPILSAAGCDVCPVPTALFSAHTRYAVFTFHDTTDILVVPEKLRTLDRGRPWRDSQFASTRLSPSRDMSR